jgi:hypothetical protein
VNGERIAPTTISAITNASGEFTVNLWPNDRGKDITYYLCSASTSQVKEFIATVLSNDLATLRWIELEAGVYTAIPDPTVPNTFAIDIASNTAAIVVNTNNISTNTNNIATNTSAINTNTNNIATAVANIATNTNDIINTTADIAIIKTPYAYVPEQYATLEAARTSTNCIGKTIVVTTALTQAQSNITSAWPSDRALRVEKGGIITVATGTTFTIDGSFECGVYQAFNCVGTGAVHFGSAWYYPTGNMTKILVQWFGAVSDYAGGATGTDNTIPIQKAIDSAYRSGYPIEINGSFKCGATKSNNVLLVDTVTK